MPITINISLKALKNKINTTGSNLHIWYNDRTPIENMGNTILCESADTKGVLFENIFKRMSYVHSLREYQKANVPMVLTSQRAFGDLQKERRDLWRTPILTVSNGGCIALDAVNKQICDKKMSEYSAIALNAVLSGVNDGIVCVGTKHGTFSDPAGRNVRAGFDPYLMTTFDEDKFEQAFGNSNVNLKKKSSSQNFGMVRNIGFQILGGVKRKDTGFGIGFGPIAQFLGFSPKAFDVKFKFQLPVPRNPLKRRKIRAIDFKVQEQTTKNALNAVLNSPLKEHYLENVDVTLTKNGLNFVPKGVSKQNAIQKFCEKEKIDPKCMLVHGDDFDDFFLPVNLKDLFEEKQKMEQEGKTFDAFESFLKLSKPAIEGPEFFMQVLAYNLDKNPTFSSMALEKKFSMAASDYNDSVLEMVKTQTAQKLENEAQEQLKIILGNLETEYAEKIKKEKDIVKQSNLRVDLEEEKEKAKKDMDERLKKAKEMAVDGLTVKDLDVKDLVTGTQNSGDMIALKRRFRLLSGLNPLPEKKKKESRLAPLFNRTKERAERRNKDRLERLNG